ncbi:uncharacterized protein LOC103795286 [Callithrix jacchus]
MSQPDQQHKLLPQPGPWCRGGRGPRGGQRSGSGAPRSFLAADVGSQPFLFLSLPRRATPRPETPPSAARLASSRREARATAIRGDAGTRVLEPAFPTSATALKRKRRWCLAEKAAPSSAPRRTRRLSRSKAEDGRQKRSETPTGFGRPRRGSEQRSRTSSARSCRHVPSCAPLPAPSPRWGLGYGRARHQGPHPRRAAAPAAGPLSARTNVGTHPAKAAAGPVK